MRTVSRPLPALVMLAGLVAGGAACESGTNPQAPAEIEESIEETGPEVVEDGEDEQERENEGATEGATEPAGDG